MKEVIYFNQGEEPWASMPYGSSTIKSAGVWSYCISHCHLYIDRRECDAPDDGICHVPRIVCLRERTSHSFPAMAAGSWGLSVERVKRGQIDYVVKQLKEGKLAVVICAENTISGSSGHFIVLTGVTRDELYCHC